MKRFNALYSEKWREAVRGPFVVHDDHAELEVENTRLKKENAKLERDNKALASERDDLVELLETLKGLVGGV